MPKHVFNLLTDCLTQVNNEHTSDLKIAILGVAYIEDSDDPRNTPTREIVQLLEKNNIDFMAHDYFVRQGEVDFSFSSNLEELIRDSDAFIIMTAHQGYKNLDLGSLKSSMKKDPIIIDGRAIFDPEEIIRLGFIYRGVGRGQYQ